MGNYRLRLSDMIPNAWFYKLRDMGRTRKQTTTPTKKKKQSSSLASSTTQQHQQQQSSKPKQPHQCNPRKSYYFTRDLNPTTKNKIHTSPPNTPKSQDTNSPRKSSKKRTKRRTTKPHSPKLVTSSVSAGCNCRTTLETVWTKPDSSPPEYYYTSSPFDSFSESESPDPEFRTDRVLLPTESSFDEMVSLSNNTKDIVIDVDKNSLARGKDDKPDERYEYDSFSELELPPIITKKAELHNNLMMMSDAKKKETKPRSRMVSYEEEQNMKGSLKVKIVKEVVMKEQRNAPVRRFSVTSPRVKIKVNSPRIGSRKVLQPHGRKSVSKSSSGSRRSLSDSFAIVKSSFNPQKDFRESMVEMIVENNIRASKDLEDLLACYLSLNSDEYHELIIKVFKQTWFDLTATK